MPGLARVTIEKKNGALGGVVPSNDGESMLIVGVLGFAGTFTSEAGIEALTNNPIDVSAFKSYTTLQEFLDINPNTDADYGYLFHHHVRKYFEASSNKLHIFTIDRATTFLQLFTVGNANNIALKNYMQAQNGSIKLIGFAQNPTYVETFPHGLNSDTYAVITAAQAFVEFEFQEGRPCHILLEGRGVNFNSGTANLRNRAAAGVSVVAWQNKDIATSLTPLPSSGITFVTDITKYAEVGYTLGLLSAQPVMRNIGRVQNGKLSYSDKIATSGGTLIENISKANRDAAADKGYIFAVRHPQNDGYFISDDPTCAAITDDFAWITRNRTMNKAASITRRVYTQRILDEVYTDPDTGKLSALTVKNFESEVEQAINFEMVRLGECTAVIAKVNPAQDVIITGEIVIELRIIPVGHARYITAKIGYATKI